MKGLICISLLFTRIVSTLSIRQLIVLCTASQYKFHAQLHRKSSIHSLTLHVFCTISQYSTRFMHNFEKKFHAKVYYSIFLQRFTEHVLCTAFHYKFYAQLKSFVQALQVSFTIKMLFPTSQDWVTLFYLWSETDYKFYALFNCLISSLMHSLTRSLHKSLVWLPAYYAQLNMIICKSQHA